MMRSTRNFILAKNIPAGSCHAYRASRPIKPQTEKFSYENFSAKAQT
jgi:hypothetical protein